MRRKWVGWFAALACAALLIPFMPWFGAPNPRTDFSAERERQHMQADHLADNQEHAMKLKSVKQDMDATAALCQQECSVNFRKLLNKAQGAKNAKKEQLQQLMKHHKQMTYAKWIYNNGNKRQHTAYGHIPAANNKEMNQYLKVAEKNLQAGKNYSSEPFTADGHRYLILGIPDRHQGTGIVSVITQDIVHHVERHQRRNLRIVPYPHEGKYKIESVRPNTMKETTVLTGEDNGNASHYHINEVVVKFREPITEDKLRTIKQDIAALSAKKLGYTYVFRSHKMETEAMMNYFKANWNPSYVEPHYLYLTNTVKEKASDIAPVVPNDALYADYQWNLPTIETEKGWTVSKGSNDVLIAVLDTGVQSDHPDLKGRLASGMNITDPNKAPEDDVGHGTHVSGIIAAAVNNGEGVAGITWLNKVMPVKVLDSSGAGSTYSVAEGIIWATDHGAKVINMSLGNYADAEFLHDAVKYAYDRDVVLVAASGNDNTDRPGYPAAYPEVLAVASTDADGTRSSFSNFGDYIDVAAPGGSIASTYPGSQYASLSGTSMASPHVAALAGLIRSTNPQLSNVEVMEIIRSSTQDRGSKGKDNYFGYGQIDIVNALTAARQSAVSLQQFPQQVEKRLAALLRRL
ncbi:S8 family peptidase [Paenibacillus sp. GCM10027626]|uniref:S8 family peptidase n=1 Tax=Paenibacillus sp. GCM10027626 TaxID=3273411 RepID=UPI003642E055